ncbi:MAG: hypothetical protein ACE5EQ_12415, partial [Phycisphaerae bacterium]
MSANATVGIEIGLPGDDWYASLYARQVGPDLTEAMLVCVLQEIGAAEFHVFDYRIPNKHDEIDRSISIATKADMRFQISDAMSAIYGPFVPGTGRPEWPATDLDRLARSGVCSACVWHEFDARINAYHHWPRPWLTEPTRPYYPLEPGLDLGASQQALSDQIAADVRPFAQRDLTVAVKHQDNTLVHLTARAGAVPNPMILKQAYNAVSFAIALGAAKQYGRPLWATLDMCGPDIMWSFNFPRHPGHSPIEFYNTLVLA